MRKVILLVCISLLVFSCTPKASYEIRSIESSRIAIDSTTEAIKDTSYEAFLAPTKAIIDKEMSIVLGYAADELWIDSMECPMLNWTADVLLKKANEICSFQVDMSLQNTGGIRTPLMQDTITLGDVYTFMPFENTFVILWLKGSNIIDLFENVFAAKEHAHGVAGVRAQIKNKQLVSLQIGGKDVDPDAIYTIATSNFLAEGKDGMTALTKYDSIWETNLYLRDIFIDAVREQGTVHSAVDGRVRIEK